MTATHENGRVSELQATQQRLRETELELKAARRHVRRLRSSPSYRLGNALMKITVGPLRAGRSIIARLIRACARVTPEHWRRRLPAPLRRVIFWLTRNQFGTPHTDATGGSSSGAGPRQTSGLLGPRAAYEGPVQVFVMLGLDQDEREQLVTEIMVLKDMAGGFLPVFVTDDDDFSALRRHGAVFEYVTPREVWASHADRLDWPSYYDTRIRGIQAHYEPRNIFVLGDWREGWINDSTYLWPLLVPAE